MIGKNSLLFERLRALLDVPHGEKAYQGDEPHDDQVEDFLPYFDHDKEKEQTQIYANVEYEELFAAMLDEFQVFQ